MAVGWAVLSAAPAQAQCAGGSGAQTGLGSVSCSGVAAWTGQAVASGGQVTYNNCLYKANQAVSANSGWCPGCSGIYLYGNGSACPAAGCNYGAQGTCGSGGSTPTPTPKAPTPTPTPNSGCTVAITPYLNVNGSGWQQTSSASLAVGGKIEFGPQPTSGTWSWTGPNGFTGSARDFTISNMQTSQSGTYTAKYTSGSSCGTQNFSITVTGGPTPTPTPTASGSCTVAITPYLNVNGTGWQQTSTASLSSGGSLEFGPQPTSGTWSWTGPNGFTGSARDFTLTNMQTNQSGTYTAKYTSGSSCGTQNFAITVTAGGSTPTPTPKPTPTPCTGCVGGKQVSGYFIQWGIYGRAYYVSNLPTSPAPSVILYAFNNIINNNCSTGVEQAGVGDDFADYGKSFPGDTYNQPLKGNFNQLKQYKAAHGSKIVMSLGGWTWSDGIYSAAANAGTLVPQCISTYMDGNLAKDTSDNAGGPGSAAGLFDGIDIDWEYPGLCGNNPSCGASSADKANYTTMMSTFRAQMPSGSILSIAAASGADKFPNYDAAGLCKSLTNVNVMTYDFFGAWAATGPTGPVSGLFQFAGQSALAAPLNTYDTVDAMDWWASNGCSASQLRFGVPFYGRGWAGNFSGLANNGLNAPATGVGAADPYGDPGGVNDYKLLTPCSGTLTDNDPTSHTSWCNSGSQWWSYDTPNSIASKEQEKNAKGWGGTFFWSFDGDNGSLYSAIWNNN